MWIFIELLRFVFISIFQLNNVDVYHLFPKSVLSHIEHVSQKVYCFQLIRFTQHNHFKVCCCRVFSSSYFVYSTCDDFPFYTTHIWFCQRKHIRDLYTQLFIVYLTFKKRKLEKNHVIDNARVCVATVLLECFWFAAKSCGWTYHLLQHCRVLSYL